MSERWEDLGGRLHSAGQRKTTAKTKRQKGAENPTVERHECNHPDGHVCPWIDHEDGTISRCDCPEGAS
jgi:hypothetical protein